MKFQKFIIKNFKGVEKAELDLSKSPECKIFPLVGLNESGKTTILEAINLFQEDIPKDKRHELIHKRDRGSFTGFVELRSYLSLNEEDVTIITNFLDSKDLQKKESIDSLEFIKKYEFKNGIPEDIIITELNIIPSLEVKTRRARSFSNLSNEFQIEIKKRLLDVFPKVLYFPDFLFDFPEKIYLESVSNPSWDKKEQERQNEYRKVIEDILCSINTKYSLSDFLGKLKALSDDGKQESANQIKREIATKLSEIIVAPWQEIFPNTPNKTIEIITGNDSGGFYLQIKINEGASSFYINERSLGFKWFFGFLLSTEFRKARPNEHGEYIFLFDEPANNLHQNSQQKLLTLFEKLVNNAKIIYSTHSHFLLNPKFLLNTFIIKDEGRNTQDEYEYRQKIVAIKYSKFVGNYPNEESHFKPVLDVLEYIENPFEQTDSMVFFEGKFDYYTFKWVLKTQFSDEDYDFKIYPGAGVDRYENIFREYLAHNRKFSCIFDADGNSQRGGKGAQKRYIENISKELEKHIFTLKDIDNGFEGFTTEKLFKDDEKLNIQQLSFPEDTIYSKSHFNTAIQELFIKNETFALSAETKANFKKILDFIVLKLGELEENGSN